MARNMRIKDWIRLIMSGAFALFRPALCYYENPVSFEDQSTFSHNFVRDLHGVQHLVWDSRLMAAAQKRSEYLASMNALEHSQNAKNGLVGENLYKGFNGLKKQRTVADAVFNWYMEVIPYDFKNPQPDLELFGHFTALAWRETTRLGCGLSKKAIYGGMMTYIVCQYLVMGNVQGLFLFNVLPIREGAVLDSAIFLFIFMILRERQNTIFLSFNNTVNGEFRENLNSPAIPVHPNQLKAPIGCVDVYERCHLWYGVCKQQIFRNMMLQYCKKTCMIC